MRYFRLSLVFASLMFITSISAQKKNVLDYYRMLNVNSEYKISKNGDKYQTIGITETPFDVTVDFKNGYIEIQDDGTGGGTVTHQIVLFRKSDGSALILHSYRFFDGVMIESSLDFHEESNGKMVKQNKKYSKSADYFTNKFKAQFGDENDKNLLSSMLTPVFDLPQLGLTIKVSFFVLTYVNDDEKDKKELQKKLLQMNLDETLWKWNKAKNQFEIVKS